MDPQTIIAIIGAVFVGVGAVLTFLATRGKTKTDAKTALDVRIDARVKEQLDGAWTEIDALKVKLRDMEALEQQTMSAVARILLSLARQWPGDHGPDLATEDVQIVAGIMPPQWRSAKRNEGETL